MSITSIDIKQVHLGPAALPVRATKFVGSTVGRLQKTACCYFIHIGHPESNENVLFFPSGLKWSYSRLITTWQITQQFGHPGLTWNKGVVVQAEWGLGLLFICAVEHELQGEFGKSYKMILPMNTWCDEASFHCRNCPRLSNSYVKRSLHHCACLQEN